MYTSGLSLADCKKCGLYNDHDTLVPTYVPSGRPKLVIIGEAPGVYELRQGRPFVGPSGQLLEEALKHFSITLDQCVLTNTCLCRPPNNRTPYDDEVLCCRPRLGYELSQFEPEYGFLVLGATAHGALGPAGSLTKQRGRVYTLYGQRAITTWHPAYILRNTGAINDLDKDLRSLIFGHKEHTAPKIVEVNRFPDATGVREVHFDIETYKAPWDKDGTIVWAGAQYDDMDEVFIMSYPDKRDLAFLEQVEGIGVHHAFQEYHWLYALGLEVEIAYDSLVWSYLVDERKGIHSLKHLAGIALGVPDWSLTQAQYEDIRVVPREIVVPYLAKDVAYMAKAKEWLLPYMIRDEQFKPWELIREGIKVMVKACHRGVKLDLDYFTNLSEKLGISHAEWLAKLQDMFPEVDYRTQPKTAKAVKAWAKYHITPRIMPSSPDQIAQLLYDHLGIVPPKFKAKKKSATERPVDAKALDYIKRYGNDDRAKHAIEAIQKVRYYAKMKGTYVDSFPKFADSKGVIHPRFNFHTTETGRLSANDPAIQQVPTRNPEVQIRPGFVAHPGYALVSTDYSQIEVRVLAEIAGATKFQEIFGGEQDLYMEFAKLFYNTDLPTKEQRNSTKPIILGIIYVRQPDSIAEQLYNEGVTPTIDVEEATRKFNIVLNTDPAIKEYFDRQEALLREQDGGYDLDNSRYVTSMVGRRRRFNLLTEETYDQAIRRAINTPVQSLASDLTLWGAIQSSRAWNANQIDANLLLLIHDDVLNDVCVTAGEEYIRRSIALKEEAMLTAPHTLLPDYDWKTRLGVETTVGLRWGKKEMIEDWNYQELIND